MTVHHFVVLVVVVVRWDEREGRDKSEVTRDGEQMSAYLPRRAFIPLRVAMMSELSARWSWYKGICAASLSPVAPLLAKKLLHSVRSRKNLEWVAKESAGFS